MNPGAEYDGFVTCRLCSGRRPLSEVREDEVQGVVCVDEGWCMRLEADHRARVNAWAKKELRKLRKKK